MDEPFLDCFSEEEAVSILTRAAASMSPASKLYIMETFWDRQKYETASFCLAQTSVYFTALANGNSKMYHSGDMERAWRPPGRRSRSDTTDWVRPQHHAVPGPITHIPQ